jgi:alanyl-tRNA synthetase
VLKSTVFYPSSGGQVGDVGFIHTDTGSFEVQDTCYQGKVILHRGVLTSGTLLPEQSAYAQVDAETREQISIHHSATHLLHSGLRNHLGQNVLQAGSLVAASNLRLDFHHQGPVSSERLHEIEHWVNQQIRTAQPTKILQVPLATAKQMGAVGLFEHKYASKDLLRVVVLNADCKELCGGTHVSHLGEIGYFKILSETGLAQGIRRIEACAGRKAVENGWVTHEKLVKTAQLLKVPVANLVEQVSHRLGEVANFKEAARNSHRHIGQWLVTHHIKPKVYRLGPYRLSISMLPISDLGLLKSIAQQLIDEREANCAIIMGDDGQEAKLVVVADQSSEGRFAANQLLEMLSRRYAIQGGGKAHFAQGVLKNRQDLGAAAKRLEQILASVVGSGR